VDAGAVSEDKLTVVLFVAAFELGAVSAGLMMHLVAG
jgi:hypothetical protein